MSLEHISGCLKACLGGVKINSSLSAGEEFGWMGWLSFDSCHAAMHTTTLAIYGTVRIISIGSCPVLILCSSQIWSRDCM